MRLPWAERKMDVLPDGPVRASRPFAEVVLSACYEAASPQAANYGLARTLALHPEIPERKPLLEALELHAQILRDLLAHLDLLSRIEARCYEPILRATDSLDLARDAAAVGPAERRIAVSGRGAIIRTPKDEVSKALACLAAYVSAFGGPEEMRLVVSGTVFELSPIPRRAGRALISEETRPLSVAVAVRLIEQLGGSLWVDGERLLIRLPQ